MPRLLVLLALLAAAAPAAADDHVALLANFDADVVGDWPDLSLPGGPDGDYIILENRFSGDETTAYVEESYYAMQDKPLVINRLAGENIAPNFYVDPDVTHCQRYTITWTSLMGNQLPFQYVYFAFYGLDMRLKTSVEYRTDGVLSLNNSLNVLDATWESTVPQDFRLEIDLIDRNISLWIDDVPMPTAQDRDFVYVNADDTFSRIIMNFGYTTLTRFGLDDMQVIAHCDQVDAEPVTWGHLKSQYR